MIRLRYFFPAVFFAAVLFSCAGVPPAPLPLVEDAGVQDGPAPSGEAAPTETVEPPLPEAGEDPPEASAVTASPEDASAEIPGGAVSEELPPASGEPAAGVSPPEEETEPGPDTSPPPEIPLEGEVELPEPRPFVMPPSGAAVEETPAPAEASEPREEIPLPVPAPVEEPVIPVPAEPPPPQPPAPADPPAPPAEPPGPPEPPSFIRPAEPEIPVPAPQPVPVPLVPPPDLPARTPPEPAGESLVFSRVVRATAGQVIEIPFRGTGWVYLGELGNRRGISYDSRRLDMGSSPGSAEGQSFIFLAEAPGTYILKFYKQDFIQDYIINDHVQVIVGEDTENSGAGRYADRGRVIAEPRWPPPPGAAAAAQSPSPPPGQPPEDTPDTAPPPSAPPVPETGQVLPPGTEGASPADLTPPAVPAPAGETSPAAVAPPPVPPLPDSTALPGPRQAAPDDGIVAVTPPQAVRPAFPPETDPAEFVRKAQQEFDAGRVEPALAILDTMKQRYPSGTDEAWWLYGQLLEANSPGRDIRLALEYYRRLVREYPQSPRAGDAQRRIAYLERYYFNIR